MRHTVGSVPPRPADPTSPAGATLRWLRRPVVGRPVILVLHGGQQSGTMPTSWRQLSVLRARLLAAGLMRRTGGSGSGVAFLRYAVRGWNEDRAPVRDACWALEQIRATAPGSAVGVVGYSMGGRVGLQLVGEPDVEALVTLGAWVQQQDLATITPGPGVRVLLLHGAQDRVTDPRGSEQAAQVLRARGAEVSLGPTLVDSHAMMRHAGTWHELTAGHVGATHAPRS